MTTDHAPGTAARRPATLTVERWPRVSATFQADGTATLVVNDREYRCAAASTARLATGVLARSVAIAATVSRPVRLQLTDASGTRSFAVLPDGSVRRAGEDGRVDPAPAPPAEPSACRRCGTSQPVTATTCTSCGTLEPHRIETTPVAVLDAATLLHPDAGLADELRASATHARAAADAGGPATRTGPRPVRLAFAEQAPVTVRGGVSLGRNPAAVRGRTPVRVVSASMTVSKTHAFVDVDDSGTIRVTDCNSANGTLVLGEPPVRLVPGHAHVLPSGATLQLGDVTCRVSLGD